MKKKKEEEYKKENIIKISKNICNNKDFELDSHQLFIKNFLSMNTPYNGLLLYHGVGTGKTCSAITVSEEMRKYYKSTGGKLSGKLIEKSSQNISFPTKVVPKNNNKQMMIINTPTLLATYE